MLKTLLLLSALVAAPVVAQPLAGEPNGDERAAASPNPSALEAAFTSAVHHGSVVLLWDAFPGTTEYIVEIARPGAPLAEAVRLAAAPDADAVGYSTQLDLPDGQWVVRLVAVGTGAATEARVLSVEAPDAFELEDGPVDALYVANG